MRQWDHLSEASAPPLCTLPGACAGGCQVISQSEIPHTDKNVFSSWNTRGPGVSASNAHTVQT